MKKNYSVPEWKCMILDEEDILTNSPLKPGENENEDQWWLSATNGDPTLIS